MKTNLSIENTFIKEFLPYAQQSIESDDIQAVIEALKSKCLTRGPYVDSFEEALAEYCGVKYVVCFHSGTTALHAAYFAASVKPGDLLFTTPNTFAGTVVGACLYGANIQYIDIDPSSGNLEIEKLNQEIAKTNGYDKKVICPVHFSGIAPDIASIQRRNAENMIVIEDAAHALGGSYPDGHKIGASHLSDMTVLSFHPAKSITTGEGGAVTTNDQDLYQRLRLFRNNGILRDLPESSFPGYYQVHHLTGNYNFTDLQGALGLSQLTKIDKFIQKRRTLVARYRKMLNGYPDIQLLDDKYDSYSAHHLMVVQVNFDHLKKLRAQVMLDLKKRNIGTQVHYIPLYKHPALLNQAIIEKMPKMEEYYERCLTLPLYYSLSEEDIEKICMHLLAVLELKKMEDFL